MIDLKARLMMLLLLTHMSNAWIAISTSRHNISFQKRRWSFLLSNVVDLNVWNDGTTEAIKNVKIGKEEEEQQQKEHQVPYIIRRGDGSTGGGGWIMKGDDDADENTTTLLRRPKVGASMPIGRPDWFRVPAPKRQSTNNGTTTTTTMSRFQQVQDSLKNLKLHTVCEEAQCPNIGECWNGGTGTIMLLGDTCTRGCLFCAVNTASTPAPPDPIEPFATAKAILDWGVSYIVLTSVDRDDLDDGGANHFATTVQLLKQNKPELLVECLVSDFAGNLTCVETLARSGLDVYAHNVETVERLQPYVRDRRAGYQQSLRTLQHAKQSAGVYTKTSLMLGLGETKDEIIQTMQDLRAIDVDVVTFGQYLRPTEHHLAVVEYVHPRTFDEYREIGEKMGFRYVASGPMVRSSYKAGEYFLTNMIRQDKPQ